MYIRNRLTDQDLILQADNGSGSPVNYIRCDGSHGEVQLFHYGTEKLNTKSDGVDIAGELQCDSLNVDGAGDITGVLTLHNNLDMQDDDKILVGTGDDLEIYHNGTHSYIDNDTNDLYIRSLGDDLFLRANDDIYIQPQNGENGIVIKGNAQVDLYYNHS